MSVVMHPCVYVLQLEDDCWYVGMTYQLNFRMAQHWSGQGAIWTRLHKPIRIVDVLYPGGKQEENEKTLELRVKYGEDKVKGGNYCRT